MSVEIKGAEQLADLAKALREAGAKDLRRELDRAINRSVRPFRVAEQRSALDTLPSRGGLAKRASRSKTASRRSTRGKAVGVKVVSIDKTLSLYHLNQGIVRHRRKGKPPEQWTVQRTRPGFWDDAAEETGEGIRRELVKAMDDIARQIERRA